MELDELGPFPLDASRIHPSPSPLFASHVRHGFMFMIFHSRLGGIEVRRERRGRTRTRAKKRCRKGLVLLISRDARFSIMDAM